MTTTIANVVEMLVQLAATLPTTDAGWTSHPEFELDEGEEGVGQVVGLVTFIVNCGTVKLPTDTSVGTQAIASYLGNYIRLLQRDEVSGTITVGGKKYKQQWTGIVGSQTAVPDGATTTPGGTVSVRCQGLAALLDGLYINRGWETTPGGSVLIDPGFCPLFNAMPTKNGNTFGDRSSTTYTINGRTSYAHDRGNPGTPWTAKQIVDFLLAGFARQEIPGSPPTIAGPVWVCTDALNVLAFVPDKLDLHGKTVLEAINLLVNPRRGAVWEATFSVISGVPTITITVFSSSPVAYTGGSYTIAASTTTCALDSRGNQLISGLTIEEDPSSFYDIIQVEGESPLVGISLFFKMDGTGSLIKGWEAGLEATLDTDLNQGPAYEFVFRRFLVDNGWNGSQYDAGGSPTNGLRNVRAWAAGGYTGARSFDAPTPAAQSKTLKLDKFLPLPGDQDYTTTPSAGSLDMTQALLQPMVFLVDAGVYEDLTDDFTISIEESPPAIELSGNVADLKDKLTPTATLIVTVGIRESAPLMVSAQAGAFQRDLPRVLTRTMPYCEQWVALQHTVMGVNVAGTAFIALSGDLVTVNDLEKLKNWLALLRVWYGQKAVGVTWTDNSQIDMSRAAGSFRPGALLTSAHRGDSAVTVNAVVTSRKWKFKDNAFSTTYTTQRIVPELEATDGHPHVNRLWRSNRERDVLDGVDT